MILRKTSRRYGLYSVAAVTVTFAGASAAQADDCDIVFSAFEALANAPAYSQTVSMVEMTPMQSVMIGDVFYVNPGDGWQKMTLAPAARVAMLKQFVPEAGSLSDCRKTGTETLEGQTMDVYFYVPPVPAGMESFADAGGGQRLWVGVQDGLPHKMTAKDFEMVIAFDGVVAPIP